MDKIKQAFKPATGSEQDNHLTSDVNPAAAAQDTSTAGKTDENSHLTSDIAGKGSAEAGKTDQDAHLAADNN